MCLYEHLGGCVPEEKYTENLRRTASDAFNSFSCNGFFGTAVNKICTLAAAVIVEQKKIKDLIPKYHQERSFAVHDVLTNDLLLPFEV